MSKEEKAKKQAMPYIKKLQVYASKVGVNIKKDCFCRSMFVSKVDGVKWYSVTYLRKGIFQKYDANKVVQYDYFFVRFKVGLKGLFSKAMVDEITTSYGLRFSPDWGCGFSSSIVKERLSSLKDDLKDHGFAWQTYDTAFPIPKALNRDPIKNNDFEVEINSTVKSNDFDAVYPKYDYIFNNLNNIYKIIGSKGMDHIQSYKNVHVK